MIAKCDVKSNQDVPPLITPHLVKIAVLLLVQRARDLIGTTLKASLVIGGRNLYADDVSDI